MYMIVFYIQKSPDLRSYSHTGQKDGSKPIFNYKLQSLGRDIFQRPICLNKRV